MLKTARKLGAELVLIDTPPKLDKAITPALGPATLVLVPLKCSILDLQALEDCVRPHRLSQGAQQDGVIRTPCPRAAAGKPPSRRACAPRAASSWRSRPSG